HAAFAEGGSGSGEAAGVAPASAAWARALGAWGNFDGNGNAHSLSRSFQGVVAGADAAFGEDFRAGFIAGYSNASLSVENSSASVQSWHLGLYGGGRWHGFALRGGSAYAWHDIESSRTIEFPGYSDWLAGEYGATAAQIFGEAAYGFRAGPVGLEPFAGLAHVHVEKDEFAESGGAAALAGGSSSADVTFTTVGVRAAAELDLGGIRATARAM